MAQIKGPALFLAQFAQDTAPYNTLANISQWSKEVGFVGVQFGRMLFLLHSLTGLVRAIADALAVLPGAT